eukprot:Hpha_TRINITY_DN10760_c0_g1::TRINITY_DN10760_c0_g1_i1::g.43482::m.43482
MPRAGTRSKSLPGEAVIETWHAKSAVHISPRPRPTPLSPRDRLAIDTQLLCVPPRALQKAVDTVVSVLRKSLQESKFRRAMQRLSYERMCLRVVVGQLRRASQVRRSFVARTTALWQMREQELRSQHSTTADWLKQKHKDGSRTENARASHKRLSNDLSFDGPPATIPEERTRLVALLYEVWREEWVARWRLWRSRTEAYLRDWASERSNKELATQSSVMRRFSVQADKSAPLHAPEDPPPKMRVHVSQREVEFLATTHWGQVRLEYRDAADHKVTSVLRSSVNYKELVKAQQKSARETSKEGRSQRNSGLSSSADSVALKPRGQDHQVLPPLPGSPKSSPDQDGLAKTQPTGAFKQLSNSPGLASTVPARRDSLGQRRGSKTGPAALPPGPTGKTAASAPPSLRSFVAREQRRDREPFVTPPQVGMQLSAVIDKSYDRRYVRGCRNSIVDMQRGARSPIAVHSEMDSMSRGKSDGGSRRPSAVSGLSVASNNPKHTPGKKDLKISDDFRFGEDRGDGSDGALSVATTPRSMTSRSMTPTSASARRRSSPRAGGSPVASDAPKSPRPPEARLSNASPRRMSPTPLPGCMLQQNRRGSRPIGDTAAAEAMPRHSKTDTDARTPPGFHQVQVRNSPAGAASPPPVPPAGPAPCHPTTRRQPQSAEHSPGGAEDEKWEGETSGDSPEPLCPAMFAAAAAKRTPPGTVSRGTLRNSLSQSHNSVPRSRVSAPGGRTSLSATTGRAATAAGSNRPLGSGLRSGSSGNLRAMPMAASASNSPARVRVPALTPSPPGVRRVSKGI